MKKKVTPANPETMGTPQPVHGGMQRSGHAPQASASPLEETTPAEGEQTEPVAMAEPKASKKKRGPKPAVPSSSPADVGRDVLRMLLETLLLGHNVREVQDRLAEVEVERAELRETLELVDGTLLDVWKKLNLLIVRHLDPAVRQSRQRLVWWGMPILRSFEDHGDLPKLKGDLRRIGFDIDDSWNPITRSEHDPASRERRVAANMAALVGLSARTIRTISRSQGAYGGRRPSVGWPDLPFPEPEHWLLRVFLGVMGYNTRERIRSAVGELNLVLDRMHEEESA